MNTNLSAIERAAKAFAEQREKYNNWSLNEPLFESAKRAYLAVLDPATVLELIRLARIGEAQRWQPIETAPKGRTAILAWCPERRNIYTVCRDHALTTQWEHFGAGSFAMSETPTHWMPLPDAPEANDMGVRDGD